ncbi:nicotinate-nucleotide--dimethylbenzimidazole phosphoribosyltransferase [Photobacterium jeanii]|uniref:Nicotinate-nucleotide--dimethylbenzimidazole phosphoribosyltransferase n=1 Tax=Photobacterium jeanii TaxID=858640 RepID=A0A178KP68_9GAMM|nr:nicotinate-nucleotide--dimethylbenzimidazole phosphoribosyltransferase [Photobacterium jeanii]OAN18362.1 nicotinate-nucleotide--dimethylbenzimidazole phosphoribosyltransferase [Photobacterium jeanii]PST91956.1 nicotinate-nucleotide--dimethylbenzimidazole phosphoribosyltransferase [Photobacterium jeanii]
MFCITSPDFSSRSQIQDKINNKTKPLGSLGKLEQVAEQIAQIQQQTQLSIKQPHMVVFAADHGIASHNISIAPQAVTQQMVANFLQGGAAINCFCRSNDMAMTVVDAGILVEPDDHPMLKKQRIAAGTQDFSQQAAMTHEQAQQAMAYGADIVHQIHQSGCNTIGFGEMGIGNTSSATAIMASLLHLPLDECIGRGTGISDEQLNTKAELIGKGLDIHQGKLDTPLDILANVGGFEIAQMVGAMLQAAQNQMLILVDGFIATASAFLAVRMYPEANHYFIYCHCSQEAGHQRMLSQLEATPLLDLGLRLGEGTGAALALPLLKAACAFYNDMASFDQAGVTV